MNDHTGGPGAVTLPVALEDVDPERLGIRHEEGAFPPLLRGCAEVLVACGVVPAMTRLVVTGDFVRSVQDRGEQGSAYHDNYNLERNTGMVGGKTIRRPDSTIDVLL